MVAPASALPNAKIEYYRDEESFLFALADALHVEYQAIIDAGLDLQVDDAFLPYMYEKMVPPMTLRRNTGAGRSCASPRSARVKPISAKNVAAPLLEGDLRHARARHGHSTTSVTRMKVWKTCTSPAMPGVELEISWHSEP